MAADPSASLRCEPVTLILDKGGSLHIPALPAADWLAALFEEFGSLEPLRNLLDEPSRDRLDEAIMDGLTDWNEMTGAFMDAVTATGGRPWWQVFLLLNLLRSQWSKFHGRIVLSGLDLERVPLAAYLDAALAVLLDGKDEGSQQKVLNYLETPPTGIKIELDEEEESNTFLALMNSSDRQPR